MGEGMNGENLQSEKFRRQMTCFIQDEVTGRIQNYALTSNAKPLKQKIYPRCGLFLKNIIQGVTAVLEVDSKLHKGINCKQ